MKKNFGLLMVFVMLLATGCTAALIEGGAAGGGYAVATDERKTDITSLQTAKDIFFMVSSLIQIVLFFRSWIRTYI
jgi:hypothetical protein